MTMIPHADDTDSRTDSNCHEPAVRPVTDGGKTIDPGSESDSPPNQVPAEGETPEVLHETTPLLWPTIGLSALVLAVAISSVLTLFRNPDLVGGREFAELLINGIVILTLLLVVRLLIKLIVLVRTKYVIHEEGFKSEYELAYRKKSREIPVEQLRGREHERSRLETLTNCATIRLLTGGTDRSLGFIEFSSIPDANTVDEKITTVRRRYERRTNDF